MVGVKTLIKFTWNFDGFPENAGIDVHSRVSIYCAWFERRKIAIISSKLREKSRKTSKKAIEVKGVEETKI